MVSPEEVRVQTAHRLAQALGLAARVLSIPSLVFGILPFPVVAVAAGVSPFAGPVMSIVGLALSVLCAAVTVAFLIRRSRFLGALRAPEFEGELHHALDVTRAWDRVIEVFEPILDSGKPSLRKVLGLIGPIKAFWRGSQLTETLLDDLRTLPRVRYLMPPTIVTSWFLTIAVLVALVIAVLVIVADIVVAIILAFS